MKSFAEILDDNYHAKMSPYRAGDNPPKVITPKWIQCNLGPSIDVSMPDYLPVVRGFFLGTQKNRPYYLILLIKKMVLNSGHFLSSTG